MLDVHWVQLLVCFLLVFGLGFFLGARFIQIKNMTNTYDGGGPDD